MLGTWAYTLKVWKAHNEAVHGEKGKYSVREVERIKNSIKELYTIKNEEVSIEDKWLFREEVKIRCEKPLHS